MAQARVEFEKRTGDFTYKAAIPEGAEPPKPHISSLHARTSSCDLRVVEGPDNEVLV
jgi:hypothetical protein